MPYLPIPLDPAKVPRPILDFVTARVEPYLRDVRQMLESPKKPDEPGFNLTAASVLCSVIGGLSRVFYNAIVDDGASFKAVAKRYPLGDEPASAIKDPTDFAGQLYSVYRCNLVHSLGLNMGRKNNRERWSIRSLGIRHVVARWPCLPLSERELALLDSPKGRPDGLPATLSRVDGKVRLDVDALYWGIRRLVRVLAEDDSLKVEALTVVQPWFDALRAPPPEFHAVQSSAAPSLHTTSHSLEETLGPRNETSGFWDKIKDDDPKPTD